MSDIVTEDIFVRLAKALDGLPNGFPPTSSGVEIQLLKRIFTTDEAEIASVLTRNAESVREIAGRLDIVDSELKPKLVAMAKRGLVWMGREDVNLVFRLAPFIVGIYESQLANMDHELAHLFEEYMEQGGAAGIMKPQPALHRVVPVHGAVKSEWILPYDDIRLMFEKAKSFRVRDCICRVQQDALNSRKCSFPLENCISFAPIERPRRPNDISKERAIALLDEAEEVGLVHCVSNVIQDVFYVCNCCGCCCGVLRGITDWGIKESVARANYSAQIDGDQCTGCGVCVDRCQVKAVEMKDEVAIVHSDLCIGCGLCVSGCTVDAAKLEPRAEPELRHPPDDFDGWEKIRVENRGLIEEK